MPKISPLADLLALDPFLLEDELAITGCHTILWFPRLRDDYLAAVEGIKKHLLRQSQPSLLNYFGELLGGHTFSPKMVSNPVVVM